MKLRDLVADGLILVVGVQKNEVVLVDPVDGAVGRDDHHVQVVDLGELARLGVGGAGHAAELFIELEVILKGDGGDGDVARGDLDPFLGFNGLVQTVRVAAAVQDAAGKLVDDLHLALVDHVIDVEVEKLVGAHQLGEVVDVLEVLVGEHAVLDEPALCEDLLDFVHSLVGEGDPLVFLVDLVIAHERHLRVFVRVLAGGRVLGALDKLAHQLVDLEVLAGVVLGRAGDDERRARLVDENRVDFVDDAVIEFPLHPDPVAGDLGIVAQVIEPELIVRPVGDVLIVGGLFAGVVLVGEDHSHRHPQVIVDRSHPLRVAFGQVVVHRGDVHALAGERVEVGGRDARKRLPFAGFHFHDFALVEHDAAHELHVEQAFPEHPVRGLAGQGEGLGKEFFHRFALRDPRPVLGRLGLDALRRERSHLGLERVDLFDQRREHLQVFIEFRAEENGENFVQHKNNVTVLPGGVKVGRESPSLKPQFGKVDK